MRASFLVCVLFASRLWAADAPPVDFAHDVVPILKTHCIECHGGQKAEGGLSLNSRELLLDAGAAKPGKAAQSALIERIESADADLRMPPGDRPRLADKEVAVLRAWIDQGLRWEAGFSFAESRYEPPLKPRRPELPPARNGRQHPIDRLIDHYLTERGLPIPGPVSDAVFLRRVSLDLIGLLPTPEQLAEFTADTRPDKRERIIRQLLSDDISFAEHWLTFWNDLLRNDYAGTGFITGGRKQITPWLYRSLVENKPYDQFVRELIAPDLESDGFIRGIRWRGDVNASQTPEIQFAQNIAQAFLGINLKCASCHDSFIDRWTLEETYALAQVYATAPLTLHRCDKPLDRQVQAGWLFPELGRIDPQAPQPERLRQLAALMTHPENGRLTRTIVNRLWHRLMGRGIVHPVDAMHTAPWNADLLDFLAVHLQDRGYDLKQTLALICTSEAYQSQTPVLERSGEGAEYVYHGPVARRMTAEQFLDAAAQITGAAPPHYDAPVVRIKLEGAELESADSAALKGRWIWSSAEAGRNLRPAGEAMTVRRNVELTSLPVRAFAVICCDNEYELFLNNRQVSSGADWERPQAVDLRPHLKVGDNQLLIVAKNGGSGPNPAGLFFEARLKWEDGAEQSIATDAEWTWTAALPDGRGRFREPPGDWRPVEVIAAPNPWSGRVGKRLSHLLQAAAEDRERMVRAALLKNNAFMTALGRPTRDQIVSMRPDELTTLEAIELANGESLAQTLAAGAQRLTAESRSREELIERLFLFALSRKPTPAEMQLALELGRDVPAAQGVEDLLWSLLMLPEFQLVR